jgi:glycosyltransferase involved in cell wall biosynthesis
MGGLERNTQTVCLALKDTGHEVTLITETIAEHDDGYEFEIVRSKSISTFYSAISGSDFLIVNGNISLKILPLSILGHTPYGVIYANYTGYRRTGSGISTRIENVLREGLANRASINIFLSAYARKLAQVPQETSCVLRNPVDKHMIPLYEKNAGKAQDRSYLLFAGRIIEGKGIFVLTDALAELDGSLDLTVMIAGEGTDEDEMRRRTRAFDTIDIHFVGRLGDQKLVDAYRQAKALVVPSTSHKEGNPLVVAEALYAGTPVIASDQPPMIESVDDAGIIVPQGNSQELARAIRSLYEQEQQYQDLRRKAEQRSDQFSYRRYKKQIASIVKFVNA